MKQYDTIQETRRHKEAAKIAKKLTYEEVKKAFKDRGYTLLSERYENAKDKLIFSCEIHGSQEITYDSLKSGSGCKQCGYDKRTAKLRTSYEDVRKCFESAGYALISNEFINAHTPMEFTCKEHGLQRISYASLYSGKRCTPCSIEGRSKKRKLSYDDIFEAFADAGYTLLSKTYIKSKDKLRYLCPKHGEQSMSHSNLISGKRCPKCRADNMSIKFSGENSPGWLGGISELNMYLRDKLSKWSANALDNNDYVCDITKSRGGILAVHHQYSFNKIVKETLTQLNMPILQTIGEYAEGDLGLLTETFIANNASHPYAVLSENIHRLYHSIYGTDNTPEQFQEFKERYDSGEFTDILSKTA